MPSPSKPKWLVIWWLKIGGTVEEPVNRPSFAIFDEYPPAESAAYVRNALCIQFTGTIQEIQDFKYLDADSHPIKGEPRDLSGNPRICHGG